jgi:hypothetical protein
MKASLGRARGPAPALDAAALGVGTMDEKRLT